MNPNFTIAFLAALPEPPSPSDFLDWGLFGVTAFYFFRYFSGNATRTTLESWELLESLVKVLQASNTTLSETNQELVMRLGESHEMQQQLRQQLKEATPYG